MRTRLPFALILSLIAFSALAEQPNRNQFVGVWEGRIDIMDLAQTIDVRIEVGEGGAIQYFRDKDAEWVAVEADYEVFQYDRNNLIFAWLNKGGVWSETQVFSLSIKDGSALDLQWMRHVNNIKKTGQNEVWDLHGRGELTKAK